MNPATAAGTGSPASASGKNFKVWLGRVDQSHVRSTCGVQSLLLILNLGLNVLSSPQGVPGKPSWWHQSSVEGSAFCGTGP